MIKLNIKFKNSQCPTWLSFPLILELEPEDEQQKPSHLNKYITKIFIITSEVD